MKLETTDSATTKVKVETSDPSLNASQLVNKHRAATHRYGCQQIALMMTEHNVTVDELREFLGEPSKKQSLEILKSKLFTHQAEETKVEEETVVEENQDGERPGQQEDSVIADTTSSADIEIKTPIKTPTRKTTVKAK